MEATLYNRCKCCLENEHLRDMWAEYQSEEGVEVYGAMLKECFEFSWEQPGEYMEQICEKCVERLRSSLSFRRDILAAQEVLDQLLHVQTEDVKPNYEVIIKFEDDNDDTEQEGIEQGEMEYIEKLEVEAEDTVEESIPDDEEAEYLSSKCDDESQPEETEMEVEFLEDDEEAQTAVKRKWPKKKPKAERNKTYKQYTSDDLEKALEMVLKNKMSRAEAAEKYSIPLKTLVFKIRMRVMDETADREAKKKQKQFFEEIRTILTYTNATPYKTKIGKLFCAYCSTDGPVFATGEELRAHTRTEHAIYRIRDVEVIMRPYYLNEILKVDIDNLHCNVCTLPIKNWNAMFDHLKVTHNVDLDLAYTRIVPHVLSEAVTCCLCGEEFSHYHLLDSHMNSHYSNYICGECGDTFLSENRLKKHVETHSTQRFPCTFMDCKKVFSLEKYRNKHYVNVHLRERRYKCKYCEEAFIQDYARHLHLLASHPEKAKNITCEYCSMTFTWRPYYLKHVKFTHTVPEKKFKCKLCSKQFHQRNELKRHEDWHIGKGYTCQTCGKKFTSKPYLKKHSATHD